mmetsp:Transcript_16128/g.41805  ORF Transcript_16128/g.41805 Transcript_16128/m.41805 type:complete len:276 (+) Transcript_16128:439-1266(+)
MLRISRLARPVCQAVISSTARPVARAPARGLVALAPRGPSPPYLAAATPSISVMSGHSVRTLGSSPAAQGNGCGLPLWCWTNSKDLEDEINANKPGGTTSGVLSARFTADEAHPYPNLYVGVEDHGIYKVTPELTGTDWTWTAVTTNAKYQDEIYSLNWFDDNGTSTLAVVLDDAVKLIKVSDGSETSLGATTISSSQMDGQPPTASLSCAQATTLARASGTGTSTPPEAPPQLTHLRQGTSKRPWVLRGDSMRGRSWLPTMAMSAFSSTRLTSG